MDEFQEDVRKAIDPVKAIYQTVNQNTLLRNRIGKAGVSDIQWREIEALMELHEHSPSGGYDVYNLYTYIQSMLAFAHSLIQDIKPDLRRELSVPRSQMSPENRVALQITLSNIDNNVQLLLDRLSEVYIAVSHLDEAQHAKEEAIRKEFPDLAESKTWELGPW